MRFRPRTLAVLLGVAIGILAAPRGAPAAETVLVEAGTPMAYRANLANPGIGLAWIAADFDDSTWPRATYGVGYETSFGAQGLIATPVPANTPSVYTRAVFTIDDVSAVENLILGADYDGNRFVAEKVVGAQIGGDREVPERPTNKRRVVVFRSGLAHQAEHHDGAHTNLESFRIHVASPHAVRLLQCKRRPSGARTVSPEGGSRDR